MRNLVISIFVTFMSYVFRYISPLIYYPYLIRHIGLDGFSEFAIVIALGQFLGQFIDFGYGLSAVKDISREGEDVISREIAANLIIGKSVITLSIVTILLVNFTIFDYGLLPSNHPALMILVGITYGFTPNWYYISKHRAKILSMMETAVALTQVSLIFMFVDGQGDTEAAIYSIIVPYLAFSAFGNVSAINEFGFRWGGMRSFVDSLKTSWSFFLISNIPSLVNRAMIGLVSAVMLPAQTAVFVALDRYTGGIVSCVVPVTRVGLPALVKAQSKEKKYQKKILILLCLITVVPYAVLGIISLNVKSYVEVLVFSNKVKIDDNLYSMFIIYMVIAAMSKILGILGLIPIEKANVYRISITVVYFIYAVLGGISAVWGMLDMVMMLRCLSELTVMTVCCVVLILYFRRAEKVGM